MKRILSFLLVFVLLVCMVPISALAAEVQTTPMYRLYNPNSGEHFYTGSLEEKNNLVVAGWNYEGIAWNAPTRSGDPVYRLYNPNSGDHHYTMSKEETDMLVSVGWKYEGICWNSVAANDPGAVPLFRLYNPNADCGSHHYTTSTEERDNLVSVGWILEGIGWFGATVSVTPPSAEVTLSIEKDYIELNAGEATTIKVNYSGASGTPAWTSSDTSVATVDSDGKVTAKAEGVAVITATYGGKNAMAVVQVYAAIETPEEIPLGPAVSVSKSGNDGSWDVGCVGNSLSFNAVAKTADGYNREVTAVSSNTDVATVSCSMNGSIAYVKVSYKGVGSTTITLTSDDGNASTSFTINVREYTPQNVSTPEEFVAACNYVIEMNGCDVRATGGYKILTYSDFQLSWREAWGQGQTAARRGFITGSNGAMVTYEGVNEEGLRVFYSYG